MKRNKGTKRARRRPLQAVKGGTLRLRKKPQAAVAPDAEEESSRTGIIRFDSEGSRLPEALAEAGEIGSNSLMPGRVVSVIAILAIVFIVIMAWFVSQMPEK
ncbi:MAG TPA: hypothetical protein VE715_01465 [Blastocatellia bacterium]|nr:hypothetical protein [Blastocatellia bacterium]